MEKRETSRLPAIDIHLQTTSSPNGGGRGELVIEESFCGGESNEATRVVSESLLSCCNLLRGFFWVYVLM
jgi:hypothetical protein